MVKLCSSQYPIDNESKYKEYFESFTLPLSDFQKYSIEAIVEGKHALICVPTGSGKTLPAEFAIKFFTSKGKRVIYTSPIKALSNQKYYDFTEKYPNISFGLITGDIKINPEADVVIMTAEILNNAAFQNKTSLFSSGNYLENCACVIHDEVHMINNAERGHVWESILMLLPDTIQNVMLSATLDHPEKFALWIEQNTHGNKSVYLTTLTQRVVPLEHKSFITCNQSLFKAIKDKDLEKQIKSIIDKPHIIQSSTGVFDEVYYHKMQKVLELIDKNRLFVKRSYILNTVCKHMVENNLLPAVCFILSRKQLEIAAREITVPLLEDDSKVPYTIARECEQILRSKIKNYQEYINLPEYINMISLLEKGIATHHSGTLPILKEIVELLFARGCIKLLFATETFSCGLNMPIKTVVFTDIRKFDGSNNRMLYGYEYNQMGGRAGRRGIDTLGTVIHLNNLYKNVELSEFKLMIQGKPQTLLSKFKVSYNLILNMIDKLNNDNDVMTKEYIMKFVKNSMIQSEIQIELSLLNEDLSKEEKQVEISNLLVSNLKTPIDIANKYIICLDEKKNSINKQQKKIIKDIQEMKNIYPSIDKDIEIVKRNNLHLLKLNEIKADIDYANSFLSNKIEKIIQFLVDNGLVDNLNQKLHLKDIGIAASQLREVPCIVFAKCIQNNLIQQLSSRDLVGLFSCFADFDSKDVPIVFSSETLSINNTLQCIYTMCNEFKEFEVKNMLSTGTNYNFNNCFINYVLEWYDAETSQDCMNILKMVEEEREVFLGEFIKGIIKINNIVNEFESVAEKMGYIQLLHNLREIHIKTLKFVATNQSLYT